MTKLQRYLHRTDVGNIEYCLTSDVSDLEDARAEWEAKEKALTSIIIEFLVADQTIRHADVGKADCKQCRVVYKARKLLNTPAAAVEDSSIKDARAAYYDDLAHGGAEHD